VAQHTAGCLLSITATILIFCTSNCSFALQEIDLQQFVGPRSGVKYLYTITGGGRLEDVGLHTDNGKVFEIEEIIHIPNLTITNGDHSRMTSRYKLHVDQGKLLKVGSRGSVVLLKEPLLPEKTRWVRIGETSASGVKSKVSFECAVADISSLDIFGKRRSIVTVKCRGKTDVTDISIEEKYATGIGLIRKTTESKTKEGLSFGVLDIELSEIK